MALITRLKRMWGLEKCVRFNLVMGTKFHSMLRAPCLRPSNSTIGKRTFFKIFRKAAQRDLKVADDIPDSFHLIYRNGMSKYILGAQIISIVTGGLVIVTFLLKTDYKDFERDHHDWSPKTRTIDNEAFAYVAFFFAILVLMQVMISRLPIRIYKIPQTSKYVTVSYGNYFFGKERYTFKTGEIFHMRETGFLPWSENRYMIQSETDSRTVILLDHYFRRPGDLSVMLGEQKDPDLDDK